MIKRPSGERTDARNADKQRLYIPYPRFRGPYCNSQHETYLEEALRIGRGGHTRKVNRRRLEPKTTVENPGRDIGATLHPTFSVYLSEIKNSVAQYSKL